MNDIHCVLHAPDVGTTLTMECSACPGWFHHISWNSEWENVLGRYPVDVAELKQIWFSHMRVHHMDVIVNGLDKAIQRSVISKKEFKRSFDD